jgi:hypothetical protein
MYQAKARRGEKNFVAFSFTLLGFTFGNSALSFSLPAVWLLSAAFGEKLCVMQGLQISFSL